MMMYADRIIMIFNTCGTKSAARQMIQIFTFPNTGCEIITVISEILRTIIANRTGFSIMLGWCSWNYPNFTIVPLFLLVPVGIRTANNSFVIINELRKLMCNGFNNAIDAIHSQINII